MWVLQETSLMWAAFSGAIILFLLFVVTLAVVVLQALDRAIEKVETNRTRQAIIRLQNEESLASTGSLSLDERVCGDLSLSTAVDEKNWFE